MLVFSLLAPAFISGILMFLAPCTLPMVPGYLAFISGVKITDVTNIVTRKESKGLIWKNAIFFVLGFSSVFIILGLVLGLFGSFLGVYREILLRISGIVILIFGFMMLGVFSLPFLKKDYIVKLPRQLTLGKPKSSFLVGGIFALGWSPCVGPVLGTLLVLAGTLGTAFQGAVLLLIFSLGLAIPFLITARVYEYSQDFLFKSRVIFKIFSVFGAIFMIIMGVVLLINDWTLFQEWGFKIFNFIEYSTIQNYL